MRAGAQGPLLQKLSFRPDAQTSAYAKHVDSVEGKSEKDSKHYILDVPGHQKSDNCRVSEPTAVLPVHETLREELRTLPQAYYDHPVVERAPDGVLVHPLTVYVDGIPCTRTDGILAVYSYRILSGTRTLLATLRKSSFCKCGCSGWCGLFQVWLFLRWCFEALAEGIYPEQRHDGTQWEDGDPRGILGGTALGYRACLIYLKCDLAELGTSLGLPSVHARLPCPWCCKSGKDWLICQGLTMARMPDGTKNNAGF